MKNIKEIRKIISDIDQTRGTKVHQEFLHIKEYVDSWSFETSVDLVMTDDYSIQVQCVCRDMGLMRDELDKVGITSEELELYLSETEDDR